MNKQIDFEPTHDYIWIEPMQAVTDEDNVEAMDLGNGKKLYLPSVAENPNEGGNRKCGRGRVVAVGPGVFTDAGHRKPMSVGVGDVVYYFHEPFTVVAAGRQVHVLQDYKIIGRMPASAAKKGKAA